MILIKGVNISLNTSVSREASTWEPRLELLLAQSISLMSSQSGTSTILQHGHHRDLRAHPETSCHVPRSTQKRRYPSCFDWNIPMGRYHLQKLGSIKNQLQTPLEINLWRLSKGRNMVRYRARVHSLDLQRQIQHLHIWMASIRISWPSRPILLLNWKQCLLRKSYCWCSIQNLPVCRNHYLRNQRWGYARTMGILGWTMHRYCDGRSSLSG